MESDSSSPPPPHSCDAGGAHRTKVPDGPDTATRPAGVTPLRGLWKPLFNIFHFSFQISTF